MYLPLNSIDTLMIHLYHFIVEKLYHLSFIKTTSYTKMRQTGGKCIMAEEIKLSYVQTRISNALLELLESYLFEEISITQIIQYANVSRASFYRNYKDKEDVIKQYMTYLIKRWGKEFEERGKPDLIDSLLRHYYSEQYFYKLLYKCGLSHYMLDTIKEACKISQEKENISAYFKAWFAGGLYCWIVEWIKRGMIETPETMRQLLDAYNAQTH